MLTVKEVRSRLAEQRGVKDFSRMRVCEFIAAGRLRAVRNKFNYWEVAEEELERFIQEDFALINPKGGRRSKQEEIEINPLRKRRGPIPKGAVVKGGDNV